MGSGHSGERATHFQNQNEPPPEPPSEPDDDEISETHHINISNKMVERLVEDAALAGGAAAAVAASARSAPPRHDHKDMILMEKLQYLDDTHSERTGLTIEEVKATAKRIDMRTSRKAQAAPVCQESAQQIIDCYNSTERPQELAKCWDLVTDFSRCVQETASVRLRARTATEAREAARRTRSMAHAREHALRDLGQKPWVPHLLP